MKRKRSVILTAAFLAFFMLSAFFALNAQAGLPKSNTVVLTSEKGNRLDIGEESTLTVTFEQHTGTAGETSTNCDPVSFTDYDKAREISRFFFSSDLAVAYVDNDGVVTALAPGNVTITVSLKYYLPQKETNCNDQEKDTSTMEMFYAHLQITVLNPDGSIPEEGAPPSSSQAPSSSAAAPTFTSASVTPGQTTATFAYALSEHCTLNYMVLPDTSDAPQNYAAFKGAAQVTNTLSGSVGVSGLAAGTDYVLYAYGANAAGLCTAIKALGFTTAPGTPGTPATPAPAPVAPAILPGSSYMTAFSPIANEITFMVVTDKPCNVYYLVQESSMPAPSAADVMAGSSEATTLLNPGECISNLVSMGGFTSGTLYTIYLVAVGAGGARSAVDSSLTVTVI